MSSWRDQPIGPIQGAELLCANCGTLVALGWTADAAATLGEQLHCSTCNRITRTLRPRRLPAGRRGRSIAVQQAYGLARRPQSPTAPGQPLTVVMTLHLLVSTGPALPLLARFSYDPGDPYAVRLGLHMTGEEDLHDAEVWIFARQLLTDGVFRLAGEGDVQVWPSRSHGVGGVCVALSSPSGSARLEVPGSDLIAFLSATYAAVPAGCETNLIDLDAEIAHLR